MQGTSSLFDTSFTSPGLRIHERTPPRSLSGLQAHPARPIVLARQSALLHHQYPPSLLQAIGTEDASMVSLDGGNIQRPCWPHAEITKDVIRLDVVRIVPSSVHGSTPHKRDRMEFPPLQTVLPFKIRTNHFIVSSGNWRLERTGVEQIR